MATLVVVTHEFDVFAQRHVAGKVTSPYLLFGVLRQLESLGHRWVLALGPNAVHGDAALLHVDSTIINDEYLSLQSHYARTINFGTSDISKRKVSNLILAKDDSWSGAVIVKSNFNNGALIEHLHNQRASRTGRPTPHPGIARHDSYAVLGSMEEVTDSTWSDPSLVVEKFLPEPDEEGGFALSTWVFLGSRERCTRRVTASWISRGADLIRYESVDVPLQLRAERERLNFDFGKFDFVMHAGEPILLDANRTPGTARAVRTLQDDGARNLAEGLNELISDLG